MLNFFQILIVFWNYVCFDRIYWSFWSCFSTQSQITWFHHYLKKIPVIHIGPPKTLRFPLPHTVGAICPRHLVPPSPWPPPGSYTTRRRPRGRSPCCSSRTSWAPGTRSPWQAPGARSGGWTGGPRRRWGWGMPPRRCWGHWGWRGQSPSRFREGPDKRPGDQSSNTGNCWRGHGEPLGGRSQECHHQCHGEGLQWDEDPALVLTIRVWNIMFCEHKNERKYKKLLVSTCPSNQHHFPRDYFLAATGSVKSFAAAFYVIDCLFYAINKLWSQ